jgi:hypothetical protein
VNEAKHTPGPWHVNGDCWVGFDRNNAEAGGYQFCAVAHVMERIGCLDANARLIAAAPDLLAACKDLMPHAERAIKTLNEQMIGSLYPSINTATLERARAAIAKAEGKS